MIGPKVMINTVTCAAVRKKPIFCNEAKRRLPCMMPTMATTIAAWLSLIISAFVAWFTVFRRGSVSVTRPAYIFFGPDGDVRFDHPKVAMCAHLFSTAPSGNVVEGMFIRLTRGNVIRDFDVWVYGNSGLSRGSGVYVGKEGITCNHHFLTQPGDEFEFLEGEYTVELFGTVIGQGTTKRFFSVEVELTRPLRETGGGVFFNWRPSPGRYEATFDYAQRTSPLLRSSPRNGADRNLAVPTT